MIQYPGWCFAAVAEAVKLVCKHEDLVVVEDLLWFVLTRGVGLGDHQRCSDLISERRAARLHVVLRLQKRVEDAGFG